MSRDRLVSGVPLTPGESRTLAHLTATWRDVQEIAAEMGHAAPTGAGRMLWSLERLGLAETPPWPEPRYGRVWRRAP